jgi:hypothetical protein
MVAPLAVIWVNTKPYTGCVFGFSGLACALMSKIGVSPALNVLLPITGATTETTFTSPGQSPLPFGSFTPIYGPQAPLRTIMAMDMH